MDDLIRRSDAIKKFEPWLKVEGYSEGELNMLKAILYELTVMPSEQPEVRTQMSSADLISRQDAIEAIEEVRWYHQNRNGEMVSGANSNEHQAWYKSQDVYGAIEGVPSAEQVTGKLKNPDNSLLTGDSDGFKERKSKLDLISRQDVYNLIDNWDEDIIVPDAFRCDVEDLASAQPEIKPISYTDCTEAMMKMWMDNVLTDGEYNRIMDKLNAQEIDRKER